MRHYPLRALAAVTALVLAAIGAAPSLLAPDPAHATTPADTADAVTWSVAPANESGPDGRGWVEAELAPGASVREHLAIRNLSTSDVTFTLDAKDGYRTPTGRFDMLPSAEEDVAAGMWIEVAGEAFVPAGESRIVPFSITVPEQATPGDHAAGIAASVLSAGTDEAGAQVRVESRVGFRIMTRVEGELSPDLAISSPTARYTGGWNPFAPGAVDVTYEVRNTGNTLLRIEPSLAVGGGALAAGAAEAFEVLPAGTHEVTDRVTKVWPLGFASVTIGADAEVQPSDSGIGPLERRTMQVTAWWIPWPQLVAAVTAAAVIACGLILRARQRRALAQLLDEARREGHVEGTLAATSQMARE